MSSKWYYCSEDEAVGPFSLKKLQAMADAGVLNKETPVAQEGDSGWRSAGQVKELREASWGDVEKLSIPSRTASKSAAEDRRQYAGVFRRLIAAFIDGFIFFFMNLFIMIPVNILVAKNIDPSGPNMGIELTKPTLR